MGHFVSTFRIPPPYNKTILVQFGASIFFAAYSKILNQWFMVANGTEERIDPPSLWYCEDPNVTPEPAPMVQPRVNFRGTKKRAQQLVLDF